MKSDVILLKRIIKLIESIEKEVKEINKKMDGLEELLTSR